VRRARGALLAGWAEIGLAGLRLFFFPLIFFEFNRKLFTVLSKNLVLRLQIEQNKLLRICKNKGLFLGTLEHCTSPPISTKIYFNAIEPR
jgi:hypothetical protein